MADMETIYIPPITNQTCNHHNWKVLGGNLIGYCTCLDCGKEVNLSEALNTLHDRFELLVKRLEALNGTRPR